MNDTIVRLTGAILKAEGIMTKSGKKLTSMCELLQEISERESNNGYQKAKKEYSQKDYDRILKLYEKGLSKEEIIGIGYDVQDVLNILKS